MWKKSWRSWGRLEEHTLSCSPLHGNRGSRADGSVYKHGLEIEPWCPQPTNCVPGPGISMCLLWRDGSAEKVSGAIVVCIQYKDANFMNYKHHHEWAWQCKNQVGEWHDGRSHSWHPGIVSNTRSHRALDIDRKARHMHQSSFPNHLTIHT